MNFFEAVVLGALQADTEYLPVSSSGHLLVMKELFGVNEVPILFDVLLHVATLAAVVIVFRDRVLQLLAVAYRYVSRRSTADDAPFVRMIAFIVVATGITGVLGVVIQSDPSLRTPLIASVCFLVTAVFLSATRWSRGERGAERLRLSDAVLLGLAQGAGVFPGISRSGITISTGLFVGLDRRTAGEFSFLLSIPAILGALVLTAGDAGQLAQSVSFASILAGFFASLIVGLLSLNVLLRIVQRGRLYLFALYLVPLGVWGLFQFS